MTSYRVKHVPGYSGKGHLAREVAAHDNDYPSLAAARRALKAERGRYDRQYGYVGGRYDIVRSDGRSFTWEG